MPRRTSGDKDTVGVKDVIRSGLRQVLDFALPSRCAGCGSIVDEVHSFCPPCWTQVQFLGDGGRSTCGMPLEATDAELCGVCAAKPPRKYGRKVALARTMARYMAPLVRHSDEPILVPVPLHRSRLWQRGFNQAALVAGELAKATGHRSDPHLLRRVKRTGAEGHESPPAPKSGGRRVPSESFGGPCGPDGRSHRRRADDWQHRECLRESAAEGGSRPRRACQLGESDQAHAIDVSRSE